MKHSSASLSVTSVLLAGVMLLGLPASAGAQAAVDEFVAARSAEWAVTLPIPAAGKFAVLSRH